MQTKIVHSHLHHTNPKVTVVEGREFFLLFRKDPDSGEWTFGRNCFRVERSEKGVGKLLGSRKHAALVKDMFVIHCCGHLKLRQWMLFCDEEKKMFPLGNVRVNGERAKDIRGRIVERREEEARRTDSSYPRAFGTFRAVYDTRTSFETGFLVSPGDVIEFFGDNNPRNCFRFSLFSAGEEGKDSEEPENSSNGSQNVPGQVPKLPEDILRNIVDLLPVKDVVESLPLVSHIFHELGRNRHVWRSMELSTERDNLCDDYRHVCASGVDSCTSLTIKRGTPVFSQWTTEPVHIVEDRLLCWVFSHTWRNLRKLHLCTEFDDDVSYGMMVASTRGLFPVLEDVFLAEKKRDTARLNRRLWVGSFPSVKVVTVRVEHDPSPPTPGEDGNCFRVDGVRPEYIHHLFPNVQRLHVLCGPGMAGSRRLYLNSHVGREILDRNVEGLRLLKELKLVLFDERATREFLRPRLPSLEVLTFEMEPNYRFAYKFEVAKMVGKFPALKRLYLRGISTISFEDTDVRNRLEQLECMGVGTTRIRPASAFDRIDQEELTDVVNRVEEALPSVFESCIRDGAAWFWKDGTEEPWNLNLPCGDRTILHEHECFEPYMKLYG